MNNPKKFAPSRDDMEGICRFFLLGKLRNYETEKGITAPHSNFFIFMATTRGQYALKFYPPNAAKRISMEYAVNRVLAAHHFKTPVMYAGVNGQPFINSHHRLATAHSYIDGNPEWQHIQKLNTIRQISAALFSLKDILSKNMGHIPSPKQRSLVKTINTLTQHSRTMAPYDRKKMIDACLLDACRTYQQHQPLFTRQWVHNNAVLTNFLLYKKILYTLDLEHVKEDYVLSDLASLVISCRLSYDIPADIPAQTIKAIVKSYFTLHQLGPSYGVVLQTLVRIGLLKEYIKMIKLEKSDKMASCAPDLERAYMSHLSERKEYIAAVLEEMNDILQVNRWSVEKT